jgi:hypothetical protein
VKRLLQIIILLCAAAAGYFLWIWTHPSPGKAVQKQMEKLAETLVSKPGEGNFARVAAINKTLSFFTPNVYINGEGIPQVNESIQGQTELQQALFAARSRLDGAITFSEIHVIVGPEGTNAHVNFHAVARLSGQNEPYSQDLKAEFTNLDGKWLISRVDPVGTEIR